MNNQKSNITVFEYESIRIDRGEKRLTQKDLKALQLFYGEKGVPYYSLIHNGIRFNQFVGVIQIGKTVIEVLPKADKSNDTIVWRNVLISMLHAVDIFNIYSPSSSDLRLRANSILDLYFELFVQEVEYLLNRGLVKKYRKTEGNTTSLKGSLQFAKHIRKNLVHQERFYVRYTTYDKEHDIHAILFKTIKLLNTINTNLQLKSRIGTLLLDFPELYDIKITEPFFEKLVFNRKTEPYRKAIEIAKLILLNYHPDLIQGTNNVLALMFDMNVLWEQFVYVSLRKHKSNSTTILGQNSKNFWKPNSGYQSKIKPDIVLNKGNYNCIVLDTKWKNVNGYSPSPDDLRQMFVYMKYYRARKVALVYPGGQNYNRKGLYYDHKAPEANKISNEECSVMTLAVEENVNLWQKEISNYVFNWIE